MAIGKKTLKPKKLWRTLRVRHSFLGSGFYYAELLIPFLLKD
jgi:hypothetical protein